MNTYLEVAETLADWLFANVVAIVVIAASVGLLMASYEDDVASRHMDCINQSGQWDASSNICHVPRHRHPKLER